MSAYVPPGSASGSTIDTMRVGSGRVMIGLLWFNLALIAVAGLTIGANGSLSAVGIGAVLALWPTWHYLRQPTGLATRIVSSMALAGLVAALVAMFRSDDTGRALQVDLHMYFFASLAAVAAWLDWRALLAYSAVVAVHHLGFALLVPWLVFPDGGGIDRVLLHAAILIAQTAVLVWLVSCLQLGLAASDALRRSESDREEAEALRASAEAGALREKERGALIRSAVGDFRGAVSQVVGTVERSLVSLEGSAGGLDAFAQRTRLDAGSASDGAARTVRSILAAAETCGGLTQAAHEIGRHLGATGTATKAAATDARESAETLAALTHAVDRISTVAATIRTVAEQTNLLALNATIEAARAGEAGRGFAVVAAEVKALASQTGRATEEITGQVADVERATARTVASMHAFGLRIAEIETEALQMVAAVARQCESAVTMDGHIAATVQQAEASAGHVQAVSGALRMTTDVAASVQVSTEAMRAQVEVLRKVAGDFVHALDEIAA